VALESIAHRIRLIRGEKVLLDSELAALYGAATKRLNEQVRRNSNRFPIDFMFQLTDQELTHLRSQNATSRYRSGYGGRRYRPFAFTEHGALMAANVLNSTRAIQVSLYVVRAFVRLRETLANHSDLAQKLDDLERKTEAIAMKHDALASETQAKFREVIETLRQLMSSPATKRRPIGFIVSGPKE
jgi:phage regulator Rha-like protein